MADSSQERDDSRSSQNQPPKMGNSQGSGENNVRKRSVPIIIEEYIASVDYGDNRRNDAIRDAIKEVGKTHGKSFAIETNGKKCKTETKSKYEDGGEGKDCNSEKKNESDGQYDVQGDESAFDSDSASGNESDAGNNSDSDDDLSSGGDRDSGGDKGPQVTAILKLKEILHMIQFQ